METVPIYWEDKNKEWNKDEPADTQDITPLRIVWVKEKGEKKVDGKKIKVDVPQLCGVIMYTYIDDKLRGKTGCEENEKKCDINTRWVATCDRH